MKLKRKPKPWEARPLPPGNEPELPFFDIVAPPRSTSQYMLAKRSLLDDLYGHSVVPCRHCGWPMLKGYNCRTCNGEQ